MKQKPGRDYKKSVTNAFGSVGYVFCFSQWFWVVMIYFSVIQSLTLLVSPDVDTTAEQVPSFAFTPPGPVEFTVLAVITIVMVAVTIYALFKIPMSIAKTSNKIVHRTTDAVVPMMIKTQHKKDTKKLRLKMTARVVLVTKVILVSIPLILTAVSGFLDEPSISYSIGMIIGVGLACVTVVLFCVQYALAGVFGLKFSDLR